MSNTQAWHDFLPFDHKKHNFQDLGLNSAQALVEKNYI